MINALLLLVWAAGVHFFCDYSTNQAASCVCYSKVVLLRPIRTLTPTDTRAHIDRYARSHRPM